VIFYFVAELKKWWENGIWINAKEFIRYVRNLIDFLNNFKAWNTASDLEKAASGASGACGHFVENPATLRTF